MDSWLQISLLLFFQSILLFSAPSLATKKTYIVHMDPTHKPSTFSTPEEWYSAHLTQSLSSTTSATAVSTTTTNTISPSPMLYSYTTAYDGYAASLSADELAALESSGGDAILGIYEDEVYPLHTTRTPEFLGLDSPSVTEFSDYSSPASGPASSDVIVGVLDTGIWPESASFDDTGLPPIPSKWRGECEYAADFKPSHCNKKLIGARIFARGAAMARPNYLGNPTEMDSPRDYEGHGTHTASTAAGSRAPNASLLGYASGIARGMAPPRARIASYKVCGSTGCFGSDILAGIDRAILDGVDVLSLSLGGGSTPYYRDPIAVGAFSAMVKGIFVSASAGNSGPTKSSLANTAPWIMTVGAGTLDRDFPAYATLGDGKRVAGVSLYSGKGTGKKFFSLVYGNGDASATSNSSSASGTMCLAGTLDRRRVSGKVVLCDRGVTARAEKGAVVRDAGGIGMILANTAVNGEEMVADSHLIPAVAVGQREGDTVREYVRGAGKKAKVALSFDGTVLGVRPSPVVAAFSSRGPNTVTPQILKPDVIGPGVNILAAWSEAVGPTTLDKDSRRSKFNIMSGTSMSCPHISGLAALIKAAHPDWSPSAIKSALMTTAYIHDNTRAPLHDAADNSISNPWAYGAGHVNPRRALSPGLVYDITPQEYVSFLCTLGYTPNRVQLVTKMPNVTCSTNKFTDPGQLNYPAFSVVFGKASRVVRYTRELTNVGPARSFYQVIVDAPKGVGVKVRPTKMLFRQAGEKKKYTVTFVAKKGKKVVVPTEKSGFGSVMWFNKQNQVRSPVSFMWS